MIVVMEKGASRDQIDHMVQRVEGLGLKAHVIVGTERTVIAAIGEKRSQMKESLESGPGVAEVVPILAPYKVAVLPLSKKEPLLSLSHEVAARLRPRYLVDEDDTQSIGRRYRRQDEIGTPLAVTVDFDSLEDKAVTIRDRDSTEQVRVPMPFAEGDPSSRC